MRTLNISFSSEKDKKEFVKECENDFEKRLSDASERVIKSGKRNILLSGPTCSGKTTTANKIIDDFIKDGKKTTVISFDDFFKERLDERRVDENEKIDYDSVDVLDLDLLRRCVSSIKPNSVFEVPVFDFVSQRRKGFVEHKVEEDGILIFEGIQAVYPEVISLFGTDYTGIFINVNEDVLLNGIFFSRDEIRFIRRIVRDRKFRGASPDFTYFLWETVRENEDKSIFPNKNICKVQIDSFMGYELFLMKRYVLDTLKEIKKDGLYFKEAEKLKEKFEGLDEISYDYIPANSLYTEFLGKKN